MTIEQIVLQNDRQCVHTDQVLREELGLSTDVYWTLVEVAGQEVSRRQILSEILCHLRVVLAEQQAIAGFLHRPNSAFANRSAIDVLLEGESGLRRVIEYLRSVERAP